MIKVYTTPNCTSCEMIKRTLAVHSIDFEAIDFADDPIGAAGVMEKSGLRTAPIIHDTEEDIFYSAMEFLKSKQMQTKLN